MLFDHTVGQIQFPGAVMPDSSSQIIRLITGEPALRNRNRRKTFIIETSTLA
jgi:hypothetical protein